VLRRTYLGVSIGESQMQAIALRRQGKGIHLLRTRAREVAPGELKLSPREPNVIIPEQTAQALRELLAPLAGREDRLSLSVSDQSGLVMLVETETPFKTRKEGIDILRWQLKKSLPEEFTDVALDFQVLNRGESGPRRVLVALMERRVLDQYQDLVQQAGFHAVQINFHSLCVYNYYRSRVDMGDDFVFIGVESDVLTIEIFQAGTLVFHRVRNAAQNAERVFQEINRSLVGFPGGQQALRRSAAFLHTNWEDPEGLREALSSLFEREPQMLDPHLERLVGGMTDPDVHIDPTLTGAIGAAEKMLWGAA
jgi:type IV pilus assembly protein PilM